MVLFDKNDKKSEPYVVVLQSIQMAGGRKPHTIIL